MSYRIIAVEDDIWASVLGPWSAVTSTTFEQSLFDPIEASVWLLPCPACHEARLVEAEWWPFHRKPCSGLE